MADDKEKKDEAENKDGQTPEAAAEAEAEAAAAAKAKKKKKMMIIIAAAVLLLGGGGGGAFVMMGSKGDKAEEHGEESADAEAEKGKHVYFQLGDMLVNLSGDGKRPSYLKVNVALELADEKDLPLMESIKPRIIDNFQVYLRELRVEDLRGSAGLYRLHEELLMRVTEAAQPIRVRDVLFQEMLVQ